MRGEVFRHEDGTVSNLDDLSPVALRRPRTLQRIRLVCLKLARKVLGLGEQVLVLVAQRVIPQKEPDDGQYSRRRDSRRGKPTRTE